MKNKLLLNTPCGIKLGGSYITAIVRPTAMMVPWASLSPLKAELLGQDFPVTTDFLNEKCSTLSKCAPKTLETTSAKATSKAGLRKAAGEPFFVEQPKLMKAPIAQAAISPSFIKLRYIDDHLWIEVIPPEAILRAHYAAPQANCNDDFVALGYLSSLALQKNGCQSVSTVIFLLSPRKTPAYSQAPDDTTLDPRLEAFSALHQIALLENANPLCATGSSPTQVHTAPLSDSLSPVRKPQAPLPSGRWRAASDKTWRKTSHTKLVAQWHKYKRGPIHIGKPHRLGSRRLAKRKNLEGVSVPIQLALPLELGACRLQCNHTKNAALGGATHA